MKKHRSLFFGLLIIVVLTFNQCSSSSTRPKPEATPTPVETETESEPEMVAEVPALEPEPEPPAIPDSMDAVEPDTTEILPEAESTISARPESMDMAFPDTAETLPLDSSDAEIGEIPADSTATVRRDEPSDSLLFDDGSLIKVQEVIWTTGIDENRNYTDRLQGSGSPGPLYLWMQVMGGQEALAQLRENGELPLRHKWFRIIGSIVAPNRSHSLTDEINLTIGGRDEIIHKLEMELAEKRYFDWRTWSMKQNIRPGRWEVWLVYADNTPVLDADGQPCKYVIDIR